MADGTTSLGIPENIASVCAYAFGFLSGGVIFALEKENKLVKFHAMQSILISLIFFVLSTVLGFIPIIGWLALIPVGLLGLILWLFLMFKAFTGEKFKLPVLGDMAEKYAGGA